MLNNFENIKGIIWISNFYLSSGLDCKATVAVYLLLSELLWVYWCYKAIGCFIVRYIAWEKLISIVQTNC